MPGALLDSILGLFFFQYYQVYTVVSPISPMKKLRFAYQIIQLETGGLGLESRLWAPEPSLIAVCLKSPWLDKKMEETTLSVGQRLAFAGIWEAGRGSAGGC